MAHVITNKCVKCKFTDCVAECPVEAIYAKADVPAQFQADIAFNAAQARQIKGAGKETILKQKEPLPTTAVRKKELGY